MNQLVNSSLKAFWLAAATMLFAMALGVGVGSLFAHLAPNDKFSWAGLAMAPLWLLLEIFLEGSVTLLGAQSKLLRLASTIALLGGFYVAWFSIRGIGP